MQRVCMLIVLALSLLPCYAEKKPNVVVIYADDLGMFDLGCYREMYGVTENPIKTPNCDTLANSGVVFTDFHSASAVCTPSRYSLLTGRYAWRTWLKSWVSLEHMPLLIEEESYTIAKMFRDAKYVTGIVGKWHLGWGRKVDDFKNGTLSPGPLETGFDYAFTVPFSHNSSDYMRPFVEGKQRVIRQEGLRNLEDTSQDLTAKAVDFITSHKDQPFFLYYPTTNVHFPVTPHKNFKGKSGLGKYGDFVMEFDWIVGQISNALEVNGLLKNTIVVVTSDNGSQEKKSNPYFRGRKGQIYESGHRVPMILSWPKQFNRQVIDQTLCQTDLLPTLGNLLELDMPDKAGEDGVDFSRVLFEKKSEFQRKPVIHHSVMGTFAIRHGKWKLILGKDQKPVWNEMFAAGANKPIYQKNGQYESVNFGIKGASKINSHGHMELYNLDQDPQETK
ncbi:MAG: arylsulfatase, partial [Lentisphaeraceae bacterium]|nr:arylsulfatase [Lentisphaeraceae bacterium]